MSFPYDFGMVKNTMADDGDPVDTMVFTECTPFPGIEFRCRTIGALLAQQTSPGQKMIRNDRNFFVPEHSRLYDHIKDIRDFSRKHNQQPENFFINYHKADNKLFEPIKFVNATAALQLLGKQLHLNKS